VISSKAMNYSSAAKLLEHKVHGKSSIKTIYKSSVQVIHASLCDISRSVDEPEKQQQPHSTYHTDKCDKELKKKKGVKSI